MHGDVSFVYVLAPHWTITTDSTGEFETGMTGMTGMVCGVIELERLVIRQTHYVMWTRRHTYKTPMAYTL